MQFLKCLQIKLKCSWLNINCGQPKICSLKNFEVLFWNSVFLQHSSIFEHEMHIHAKISLFCKYETKRDIFGNLGYYSGQNAIDHAIDQQTRGLLTAFLDDSRQRSAMQQSSDNHSFDDEDNNEALIGGHKLDVNDDYSVPFQDRGQSKLYLCNSAAVYSSFFRPGHAFKFSNNPSESLLDMKCTETRKNMNLPYSIRMY